MLKITPRTHDRVFSRATGQEIVWKECRRNDLFCVEWDVKPQLKGCAYTLGTPHNSTYSMCGSLIPPFKPKLTLILRVRIDHAPAILAALAVYCIHGCIMHQAGGHQTVQNVNEKHAPSPLAGTANMHQLCCQTIGSWPSDHYFRSVCLFVCLFMQCFSQPSLIRFRSN